MMTMLHSVWSGGGSAAGRRRSLLALGALLALIASVLIWAAPTQAQNTTPPIAIAKVSTTNNLTGTLDASDSFDPDDADAECTGCAYKWEVVTAKYYWLALSDDTAVSPTFNIPDPAAAAQAGQTIEFRLTVTDNDTPPLSHSATVEFNINQMPTADIALSANLFDKDSDEKGVDAYTIDAVIDGPGENGNDENEWDIMEGALLVLDGSGSSDPNGRVATYSWTLMHPTTAEKGIKDSVANAKEPTLSTDDDSTDAVEAVENLTPEESPYYVYYTLTVTDDDDISSSPEVVKIVVWDQPASPEITLTVAPATLDTSIQKARLPFPTPRYILSPGNIVTVTAAATDADDVEGEATTIVSYEWSGGKPLEDDEATVDVDESEDTTKRRVEIPKDAEEGTIIPLSVAVTDNTGRVGDAALEIQVVDNNTGPSAIIVHNPGPTAATSATGLALVTNDGQAGGDHDAEGNPTGRITLRGVPFDPDQSSGSLLLEWRQVDPSDPQAIEPLDPDTFEGILVELEHVSRDTVSFDLPEIGTSSTDTASVTLVFAVLDRWSVAGFSLVTITVGGANSSPSADAGPDQVVEPGAHVRLDGAGSSDPDKGDTIDSHSWSLTRIETSPATEEVPRSVSDQVHEDLKLFLPAAANDPYRHQLNSATVEYPYFTAPEVADGISDIRLTYTLTVTDGNAGTDTDTVTITVTNRFFSGPVTGPDFCTNMSLGGPRTFAFDSDGDGVADVCSLRTTRRATVARQNALQMLVSLRSTLSRTDAGADGNADTATDNRTSEVGFAALVVGQDGVDDDSNTADVNETQAAVAGTCTRAPDMLGDSAADLAADACSTGRVSDPPAPVDPTLAGVFFSGVVTGPDFCTNLSLGGPRTFAFDSDGDGVADLCALPYTRREAVARQNALEQFDEHPQYAAALAAACAALGSTDFGDNEADLARDECVIPPVEEPKGEPLPTAG